MPQVKGLKELKVAGSATKLSGADMAVKTD
jgi:hypothetical protein